MSGTKTVDLSRSMFADAFIESPDPDPYALSYWKDEYTKKGGHKKNATNMAFTRTVTTEDLIWTGQPSVEIISPDC